MNMCVYIYMLFSILTKGIMIPIDVHVFDLLSPADQIGPKVEWLTGTQAEN